MVAAQINGIQGAGAMSEMKHFAVYNGQNQSTNTDIGDQALHQIYLTPYEAGFVQGRPRRRCAPIRYGRTPRDAAGVGVVAVDGAGSPYGSASQNQTWPLGEAQYSCEQPLTLTYALRDLWGSGAGRVGLPGDAQHLRDRAGRGPGDADAAGYFSDNDSLSTTSGGGFGGPPSAFDPTGTRAPMRRATPSLAQRPAQCTCRAIPRLGLPGDRLHLGPGGGQRNRAAVGV